MFWNWICYVFVMGCIGFSAVLFNNRFFVILLIVGLMLPIISLIFMLRMRSKLYAALHADGGPVRSGDLFPFYVAITNRGRIPAAKINVIVDVEDVLVGKTEDLLATASIPARATGRAELMVQSMHCGRIILSIRKAVTNAPFGFFRVRVKVVSGKGDFLIYPEIVNAEFTLVRPNPYAYIANEEYSATRPGDDPAELFGVREYRAGDRQNRIHWNLTASRDVVMVKELGLVVDTSVLVLLDIYEMPKTIAAEQYDALMSTVASVARRLLRDRQIFYIGWLSESGNAWHMRVAEDEEWEAVQTQLFSVHPYGTDISVTSGYAKSFPEERYRNIVYISNRYTKETAKGIDLFRADANVTVLYVTDESGAKPKLTMGERVIGVRAGFVREDLGPAADAVAE